MEKHQVDFTLCRLAAITISKRLWKYSYLKISLKDCLEQDETPAMDLPANITETMSDFDIPEPAKQELTFVVCRMGRDMYRFYLRLRRTYYGIYPDAAQEKTVFPFEPSIWVDHIRWASNGCVDDSETMRSLYMSDLLPESITTWLELCSCCLEDCITDFYPKRPNNIHSPITWLAQLTLRSDINFDMMLNTYWSTRVEGDLESAECAFLDAVPDQLYDEAYSVQENMFIYSFVSRKDSAVELCWGLLDEDDRKGVIAHICERTLSDDPTTQPFKDLFFSENSLNTRLLIFFLQQLSLYGHNEMRIELLGSGFVLRELLDWPYDGSFLETLKESWIHHDSIDYGPIILRILSLVCCSRKNQFIQRDVKYRSIFYEIWRINPKNLKSSINYSQILTLMWRNREVKLLNLILNDEELSGRRTEFLNRIIEICDARRTKRSFLETFITRILVSEEERNEFRSQIAAAIQNRRA